MAASLDPIIIVVELCHYSKLVEYFKEEYLEAMEEIDKYIHQPLLDELAITVFVYSYHAHNKVACRPITGLIILFGRNPVFYYSKKQGSVKTSIYSSEFMTIAPCCFGGCCSMVHVEIFGRQC